MAVPPYSMLLAGKLLALLALSTDITRAFQLKYDSPLLGLSTTCATGIHCPVFNRIGIVTGGLYKRIGETSGYTTAFFSDETLDTARRLLSRKIRNIREFAITTKPIRMMREALRYCNLPEEAVLCHGNKKGVYIGCLSNANLAALRSDSLRAEPDTLGTQEAIKYWKDKILVKRLGDTIRLANVRAFQPTNSSILS
jgi:hypothetical protein